MTPTGDQEFQHHPIIAAETGIQQSYKTTPAILPTERETSWKRSFSPPPFPKKISLCPPLNLNLVTPLIYFFSRPPLPPHPFYYLPLTTGTQGPNRIRCSLHNPISFKDTDREIDRLTHHITSIIPQNVCNSLTNIVIIIITGSLRFDLGVNVMSQLDF